MGLRNSPGPAPRRKAGPVVAVVGLGATGTAALCRLALRGITAIGIEQFSLGHDRGSSHGPTRIIRLAHFENPAYLPLLRRGYELWRELEVLSGRTLVVQTGIVEAGHPDGELVRGTMSAIRRYDLAHKLLDVSALARVYPAFRLPDEFVAVLQPDGGYIEAAEALNVQIRIAQAAGAQIRTGAKVLAIEPTRAGLRIVTQQDRIEADAAIIAAGPWMRALLPDLSLPLRVTRQVVGWFEPAAAWQFSAERFPVFILESRHGIHYGLPLYRDMGLKLAKHHHLDETAEPDARGGSIRSEDEAAIRAPLPEYLPDADGRLLSAQTCRYTVTPDETFIIDRMAGHPQIVLASPCCGHGFKFSPVVGEILADLVTQGATAHDITPFRLDRF